MRRYERESPAIAKPEAIVVSGDIIQGVKLGEDKAGEKLAAQYDVAGEFLLQLADRFVEGDRSRVIIVPGNHDIDWVTARAAMEPVPAERMVQLPGALYTENSMFRWNWRETALYEIIDGALYEQRLDAFWNFFDSFYDGVDGLLSVGRERPVNLFSLAGGRIGVAAFNSCYGNDCFAFQGNIPREAVANAHLELSDARHNFELLIAVWHHNVEGPPHRSDYMDVDIVRGMIGRGFRVGLYGHQHRAEAVPHHIHLAEQETMAVIAAGSLCAGSRELPPGAHRGYNIIELADDLQGARIHIRQTDTISNLFTRSPRTAFGGNSWTDIRWSRPPDLLGRMGDPRTASISIAIDAADAARRSDPDRAVELLLPHRGDLPDFGRKLLIDAAMAARREDIAIELLQQPQNTAEVFELTQALVRVRRFDDAEAMLGEHATRFAINPSHLQELNSLIAAHRAMNT